MGDGPLVEWRDTEERPTLAGGRTVTPVAQSLVIRWPGGGCAWSGPSAVLVERDRETVRIPIANLNRRILWAMRAGAVAFVAAWIAMDRDRRGESNE